MISPGLTALFPDAVRRRADDYVRRDAVRIARRSNDTILAVVEGSRAYAVELHAAPGQVMLTCTCPFAEERGVCKHLWAVIVLTDRNGALAPLLETAGPRAQFFGIANDDFDADDEVLDEAPTERPWPREDWMERPPPPAWASQAHPRPPGTPRLSPLGSPWKQLLSVAEVRMRQEAALRSGAAPAGDSRPWPAGRRIVYVLDLDRSPESGIIVDVLTEKLRRDGEWDPARPYRVPASVWFSAPDLIDRQLVQMLQGAGAGRNASGFAGGREGPMRTEGFLLLRETFDTTLRMMVETGRCRARVHRQLWPISRWDEGPPWRFGVRIGTSPDGSHTVEGSLIRGAERLPLAPPTATHSSGLVLLGDTIARFEAPGTYPLVQLLYGREPLVVGADELPDLLATVLALPAVPTLDLPPEAAIGERKEPPQPVVAITTELRPYGPATNTITLQFRYGRTYIDAGMAGATLYDRASRTLHHRDVGAERAAIERLLALGVREMTSSTAERPQFTAATTRLASLTATLVGEGWRVELNGATYRVATETRASLSSGVDWFDLDATARFGDVDVSLGALLDAQAQGKTGVVLADGTVGLLPAEWMARWKVAAAAGRWTGGAIRFTRSQTALLDALLATAPEVDVDETFATARAELARFDRVAPAEAPPSFVGTLRDYQREGLGWLHFLQRLGLGGCLADDMGLGKTVQVLAMLDGRRAERAANGPSLVVVPRSLVRNWIREAERFTPQLRVRDVSAGDRQLDAASLADADLLVVTYGVLRRDAAALREIVFDYAILDEAQAVKNAATASAKAARLLQARHRLAVTGTPIENRLEELWSLFEFLNPGMLGARAGFARLVRAARDPGADSAGANGEGGESAAALLSRALRPVILRRTKADVASELPPRTEQTLEVELEPAQRRFYDSILERYRASVLARVDRMGIERSRMHILEALLRLRQAACHPGLVDPARRSGPSAKLDALVPALTEVVAEGHKALVFSQFTTLLALVREALDAAGLVYEYLDGKTRDRQRAVDRFQDDPACPLFLISLKAGGQGLNLTAADYVFLLDPWWNPAVEAQAIDRTHRIGQTRSVIATRLVARATIEEKILQLQAGKRALADAILAENQGLLAGIGRREIELLLG
jgi:superfamily II DNA or RNA helicase